MFSISNLARITLSKIISGIYLAVSVLCGGISAESDMPKTPEDFTPVVRFAVCSDIHLNADENQAEIGRLAKLINVMYDYSENQSSYNGFDALVVVGDMTENGAEIEYDTFNNIISENLKPETQLLTCLGNHEFIESNETGVNTVKERFSEKLGHSLDTSVIINGYHFILCSYEENKHESYKGKKKWLNNEIKNAVNDSGDKPVFVFQHAAPKLTVYGSIHWADSDISQVLDRYPSVIDFSGHSHYPINDPRSIWQGNYTAISCGSLSYFETELDFIAGNFPYSFQQAAQFNIVEADANGNVRVMQYDLITDDFFSDGYYLTGLKDGNFDYTFTKMRARDDAPIFNDDTTIYTRLNEKGETELVFDGATDNFVVESYKISATRYGFPCFSDNFSGKYMYLFEKNSYIVNMGVLKKGKYNVNIVALNAYAKVSKPLCYSFEII